jgi:hypothetical protein
VLPRPFGRRPAVTTFAPHQTVRRLEELDELTRDAWAYYHVSIRELEGREYDDAERASWAELQATLRALGTERDALLATA